MIIDFRNKLSLFFKVALHPSRSHEVRSNFLNPYEAVLMATIFYFVAIFYKILFVHLGFDLGQEVSAAFMSNLSPQILEFKYLSSMTLLLLSAAFAPLTIFIEYRLWLQFVKFMSHLFEKKGRDGEIKEQKEKIYEEIVSASMSSYVASLLPILGTLFRVAYSLYILYVGLRARLLMSRLQAMITLLAPVIIIMLLLFWWLASVVISLIIL